MNRLVKVRGFDDEVSGGGSAADDDDVEIDDVTFFTG